ncbi:hypothetical protein [Vannielia litorea]|uniref:hypothetical protein n=1 Tax=Vannielia litorea TaxID=1217970 RepID=UPI001C98221A|nr:hypothetical protein [Vannielia litorea]MBY6046779.1 hypothetical protein [Vannielia litorea]MBY6074193.1 hypothetical protein [Vannielia litorea]
MSDSESFIDEVTEELRRDRLFSLMRRYGWIPLVIILALVGGAAWFEWQRSSARAEAEARGDAVLAALQAEEGEARLSALEALEADGEFAAVLDLLKAAEAQSAEDPKGAAEILLGVANDASLPQPWRDLAGLKAVMLGSEAMEPDTRKDLLDRIAASASPMARMAREQQVYLLIETGDREAALAAAQALVEEDGLSRGLQERLLQVIVALGGKPEEG